MPTEPSNLSHEDPPDPVQMYTLIGRGHLAPYLFLPALCMNAVAVTGLALNSFVIYCTLRHRSLRNSSNYLLAMHCTFELLHQSGHLTFGVVALSGLNFVQYETAMRTQAQSVFGVHCALVAIAAIAVDRLWMIMMSQT